MFFLTKKHECTNILQSSCPGSIYRDYRNISNDPAGRTTTLYIDTGHLTEDGNRMIAEKIVALLKQNPPEADHSGAP